MSYAVPYHPFCIGPFCCNFITILGVSNGPLKFSSARKIWSLLHLLAKFIRVLACSCSQNFRYCSHARILVKICQDPRNSVYPALCRFFGTEINVFLHGAHMNSAIKFSWTHTTITKVKTYMLFWRRYNCHMNSEEIPRKTNLRIMCG